MTTKPTLLIAHWGGLDFFTEADRSAIAEVATILDPDPVDDWSDKRAAALLAQAEVIVGHWGCPPLSVEVLDRAPRLGLFAYAAGTIKATVEPEVFDRSVRVTSGASANAEPVAEFTLAAVLFAGKDVFWRRDRLRDPSIRERRQTPEVWRGNWDKTIAIVGASLVGRRVIELLAPFAQLRIVLYDPFVSTAQAAALGVEKLELDELCAQADILSIHAPDLPSTRHLIGAPQLAALRTGATVINTARPAIVDQDALVAELETGRLYAILDVTDPEPLPPDHVLAQLSNAFVTPHLAGSEGTELRRLTEYVVEEIRRWSAGEPARNEVTKNQLERLA